MSEKNVFMPLIELPSGVCIDPTGIAFIARRDLNKYQVFFRNTGAAPEIDGKDLDVLRDIGVVQKPPALPEAANNAVIETT